MNIKNGVIYKKISQNLKLIEVQAGLATVSSLRDVGNFQTWKLPPPHLSKILDPHLGPSGQQCGNTQNKNHL